MNKTKPFLDDGNGVVFEIEYNQAHDYRFTGNFKVGSGPLREGLDKDYLVLVTEEEYTSVKNFLLTIRGNPS